MNFSNSALLKDSTINQDLNEAYRVLNLEAGAILKLSQSLNQTFIEASNILMNTKGKVIVSGIGKSGHIANKIASTFSSTGTPAFFIHPSEASHGDLGMITKNDTVIILSNSGETSELSDLIYYLKRFSIKLISITSREKSSLAQASNTTLLLPSSAEACPMGLAPTTSTTLMLALGDALAVTLLKRKGFTERDFKNLHPGGKLGQKLLYVENIMQPYDALPLVEVGTKMGESLVEMTSKGFGCIGILKNDQLAGIITDGDLRRHMGPDLLEKNVEEIMTSSPHTISKNSLVAEALGFMNHKTITNIFVIDEKSKKLVGLLRMHDCLREGVA